MTSSDHSGIERQADGDPHAGGASALAAPPEGQNQQIPQRPAGALLATSRLRQLRRDLADAIRGTEMDYTRGSIGRAIFLLAVPMMLEMVLESVFAVVDVYFVSSLGASAVATVGLTESVLTLIYAVAIGLAMGTTALVARRIGEKNPREAADAAVQAIIVALAASIPFSIAGIFFAQRILILMGADAWAIEHGWGYTAWMLGGNAVVMLIFIINAIFRGAGDAAIAMRVLWIANGINIVLDPILIYGWGPFPEMGVTGAAIATNIGRGFGVLIQLYVLFRGAKHIRVALRQVHLHTRVMWRLIRTSLGGIGQFIIATSSWVFLVRIVSEFGAEALAGYTIAVRILVFTFLPAWGLSNAAATLVGQNLGAKQPQRAERSVWMTGLANMCFLVIVSLVYILFSEPLVRIFTAERAVIEAGSQCLMIVSFGYLFYAWGMVMPQAFNGAGDTWTPTKINFVCFWLLEIPLAYVLAMTLDLKATGVYWSIVIAESTVGIVGIMLFRRGTWKKTQL
ncbi:MAG: MATE family efflux transporter [Phycisphaerales bacterium]|nr:MATE family efflux transporter [Phycisphaerales bacterium]